MADVAGRARRERAAADASDGCVEHGRPGLERRERVREAGVARVVQVDADRAFRAATACPTRWRTWLGTPTPIVSASTISSGAAAASRPASSRHPAGIDRAFERAAERGADRNGGADPVRVGARDDRSAALERLLDRGVLVPLVEGLGRGEGEVHLVEPGRDQPVVARLVERETRVDDARPPLDRSDDLLGARHLRDARRVDEADGLDPRQTRPPRAGRRARRASPARGSWDRSGGRRAGRRRKW